MKILVSSKALANKLSRIDFANDSVFNVVLNPVGNTTSCELSINTNTQSIKIVVESIKFQAAVNQEHRNWKWVMKLLSSVEEQPVVLEISEHVVNVIFQY